MTLLSFLQVPRRERIWRLALIGSVVVFVNHLAFIALNGSDPRLLAAFGNVLLTLECVAPVLACALVLQETPRRDPRLKFDALMGVAGCLMVVGQALWTAAVLARHGPAVASLTDAFVVLAYLVFAAAVLLHPTRRNTLAHLKVALDLLVFVVAGALVMRIFGVAPVQVDETSHLASTLLSVVLPVCLAVVTGAVLFRRRKAPSAHPQMFATLVWLGVAARLLTDVVFAYQLSRGEYIDGGFLDLGYTLSVIYFALAWLWRWKHAPGAGAADGGDAVRVQPVELVVWNRLIPQLGLLLVLGMLVWSHYHADRPDFMLVAVASAAITLLLTLREVVALKEVEALYRRQREMTEVLQRAHAQLERRVEARTLDLAAANEQLAQEAEALRQARADLQASLTEKEALLQEVHHRVKNNLQVVSSLLALQARSTADPNALQALLQSQARLRAMSLIHQKLYQSGDLARVHFGDYLQSLADHLLGLYAGHSGRVRVRVQVAAPPLDLDTAVPCGLIVSELVSNALKHAFPGNRSGTVCVVLQERVDGRLELSVADDGVGLPPGFDSEQSGSLGLKLIASLTHQLGGQLAIDAGPGTTYRVVFAPPCG